MAKISGVQTPDVGKVTPTWSLCIATINRMGSLDIAIACAVAQTCAPQQIIVIDAGADPDALRERMSSHFKNADIEFIVEKAAEKSLTVQRNQAIALVDAEIIVFTDDDAFMFPDSIEKLLEYYSRDRQGRIAGAELVNVPAMPPVASAVFENFATGPKNDNLAVKDGGPAQAGSEISKRITNSKIWRWFSKNVLMMSRQSMFIPYDTDLKRPSVKDLPSDYGEVKPAMLLPGYGMSVRTEIARRELFNPNLLAYCPCEDLDASYRYGRHGVCILANDAYIHHHEVQASRIGRKEATSLGISNMALFIHTNSDAPRKHRWQFAVFVMRRFVGEVLKDTLTRRFDYPQARGVLTGIPRSIAIFRKPLSESEMWYISEQRRVLSQRKQRQVNRS